MTQSEYARHRHLGTVRLAAFFVIIAVSAACSSSGGSGDSSVSPTPTPPADVSSQEANDAHLSLCGVEGDWAAVVAAAEAEGEVGWYVGLPPGVVEDLANDFMATHPNIDVLVTRAASGALVERFRSEAAVSAVAAGVLTVASLPFVASAGQDGLTLEIAEKSLPSLSGIDDAFISEYFVQATLIPWGIDYNTELVSAPVTSYEDLLRPEFAGAVVLTDPRPGGAVAGNVNYLLNTFGEDFLRRLAPQISQVVDSISLGVQLVAAGEAKAVIQSVPGANNELVAGGAKLAYFAPDQTSAFGHYLAIPANSPSPNAACVLADWLLGDAAQARLGSVVGPAIRESARVTDGIRLPAGFKMVDVAEAESRRDLIAQLLGL